MTRSSPKPRLPGPPRARRLDAAARADPPEPASAAAERAANRERLRVAPTAARLALALAAGSAATSAGGCVRDRLEEAGSDPDQVLVPRPEPAPHDTAGGTTTRPTDSASTSPPVDPADVPNVLLVVGDDVGAEQLSAYGLIDDPPPTPRLARLASEGTLFERAWANPVCSPTRASILTGRHAFRTGVGLATKHEEGDFVLPYDELLLPEALDDATAQGVSHAAVGKWHLGNVWHDGPLNPLLHGFGRFVGTAGNLIVEEAYDGLPQDYQDWEKNTDGTVARTTAYATTEVTDDALRLAAELPEPWFLYVAYHAAHDPYHVPPPELHGPGQPETAPGRYRAMVESLDTELGRLLDGLDPEVAARTVVLFLGDNGTPEDVAPPPIEVGKAKKSVYEAGIRVPLLVRWPGVTTPGSRVGALVGAVDLYATVLDLAGVPEDHPTRRSGIDSVSLVPYLREPTRPPLRELIYAERFEPAGFGPYADYRRAIRDPAYKLHSYLDGHEELYALRDGWLEGEDLLAAGPLDAEAEAAWRRLHAALPPIPGVAPGRP